jgi:hypothetical protein
VTTAGRAEEVGEQVRYAAGQHEDNGSRIGSSTRSAISLANSRSTVRHADNRGSILDDRSWSRPKPPGNGVAWFTLAPGRYDIEENGEEVGDAARQHENMPNRMVVRKPSPGVETEPQGVVQASHKQ